MATTVGPAAIPRVFSLARGAPKTVAAIPAPPAHHFTVDVEEYYHGVEFGQAVFLDDIGTNLNLLFRLSYCGKRICASFAHISHGGALGIETDKANSGLNFLYLEYRYR